MDISKLRGKHIYLELLSINHRETIHFLSRDARIWEFNKMLDVDDNYDTSFDEYFITALDKNALGGQQTLVIRKIIDDSLIGMTRLYEINPKEKTAVIGYTWYTFSVG